MAKRRTRSVARPSLKTRTVVGHRESGPCAPVGPLTQQNPFGVVLLQSNVLKTFTIGFPAPLRFQRLRLAVTVNEPNVVQILANVIHGV